MITHNAFVKKLNIAMRADDLKGSQELLDFFCKSYIPYNAKCSPYEWTVDILKQGIPDNTICVMAHSSKEKRVLARIHHNPSNSKYVPEKFCYSYKRIQPKIRSSDASKSSSSSPGGFELAPDDDDNDDEEIVAATTSSHIKKSAGRSLAGGGRLNVASNAAQALITPRRGFWVIWAASLEQHITWENKEEHEKTLLMWYTKYVMGMEKVPAPGAIIRERDHCHFEQFLLQRYPTKEWRLHTLESKKRKREEERFRDDGRPPPPPPVPQERGGGRKKRKPNTSSPPSGNPDDLPLETPLDEEDGGGEFVFEMISSGAGFDDGDGKNPPPSSFINTAASDPYDYLDSITL